MNEYEMSSAAETALIDAADHAARSIQKVLQGEQLAYSNKKGAHQCP